MTGTDVVNWEDKLKAEAQAVAQTMRPPVGRISNAGGAMMYEGTPIPNGTIDVVILSAIRKNAYYSGEYEAGNPVPPDCFALSVDGRDMRPHESVPQPQNFSCAGCPMDAWGSSPKGGKGKACKEYWEIAMLPASNINDPAAISKSEIALMGLPVTSGKYFEDYCKLVAAAHNLPYWAVVTRISRNPHKVRQFEIKHNYVSSIQGNDYLGALHARSQEAQGILMTPFSLEKEEEPAAASGKKKKY